MSRPLGRLTPPDFEHVAKYPLSAIEMTTFKPVTIGTNWYTSFDTPRQLSDGSWHLPDSSKESLGSIRGGHATALVQMGMVKLLQRAWQIFYNQGPEGACEGFSHAYAQTLEKGVTFDPWFLYDQARKLEGTFPSGEGTTNRSVCSVLQKLGVPTQVRELATRGAVDGATQHIATYRWATTAEEVCNALGRPNANAVPLLSPWGLGYPQPVWLPVATLERLLHEDGEADIVTDQ
jgi:hypothetical protein